MDDRDKELQIKDCEYTIESYADDLKTIGHMGRHVNALRGYFYDRTERYPRETTIAFACLDYISNCFDNMYRERLQDIATEQSAINDLLK